MENNNIKEKKETSGFLTGFFCALAGVAIGIGGKMIYDELKKEDQPVKANEEIAVQRFREENKKCHSSIVTNMTTNIDTEYESFLCPISQEIMRNPVITPKGISYEKTAILNWLQSHSTCPVTKTPLKSSDLITNYALKCTIDDYLKKQNNDKNKSDKFN